MKNEDLKKGCIDELVNSLPDEEIRELFENILEYEPLIAGCGYGGNMTGACAKMW